MIYYKMLFCNPVKLLKQNNRSRFMKNKDVLIFDRDTLLHLRLPFSFFLLPIFFFSISQSVPINGTDALLIFFVLHFLIYPASNSYNSYMDKDKGSIGGLKNPPPVTKKLYYASILLDGTGLLLCLFIHWKLAFLMLGYVGVSKAYSWKNIRLKKYGIAGWFVVALFQGGYTFMLVSMAAENNFDVRWFSSRHIECMILSSLLIGGFYPLTQVYQHEEDSERGDKTISYLLGIKGTFRFTALLFITACTVAYHYFNRFYLNSHFFIFIFSLLPVLFYFLYWYIKTSRNESFADYKHTMRMTFLSSSCMIVCFSIIFVLNHG